MGKTVIDEHGSLQKLCLIKGSDQHKQISHCVCVLKIINRGQSIKSNQLDTNF